MVLDQREELQYHKGGGAGDMPFWLYVQSDFLISYNP